MGELYQLVEGSCFSCRISGGKAGKEEEKRGQEGIGREREGEGGRGVGEGWEGIVRGISLGKLRERAQSLTIGIMKATYSATSDETDIKNASIGRHTRGVLLKKAERKLTMTRKRTMPLMV